VEVNKVCHDNKVGFVLSECLGVFGYAFVDYGEKHFVSDADGIATKPFIVSEISNE
jgi:ubiquitin-activating enzyme E1